MVTGKVLIMLWSATEMKMPGVKSSSETQVENQCSWKDERGKSIGREVSAV